MKQSKCLASLIDFEHQYFQGDKIYENFATRFQNDLSIDGDLIECLQKDEQLFATFLNGYQDTLYIVINRKEQEARASYQIESSQFKRGRRSDNDMKRIEESYIASLKYCDNLHTKLEKARYGG